MALRASSIAASRIIIALDFAGADAALALARQLDPARCRLKVGQELYTRAGPPLVERLVRAGFDVFLDLKFHDIPSTVAAACAAAAELRCWMVNLHAQGGLAMLTAAREQIAAASRRPLLIAVTLLTSLKEADLRDLGISGEPPEVVLRLARLAHRAGLDGVVCSPQEVPLLRRELPREFLLVTPGIRPAGAEQDDQLRTGTPGAAVRNGADYLVIGRPITRSPDPLQALAEIEQEIASLTRTRNS
ncbi:MAG: orotidine-5'-phosphate decarboxylase [Chromatiales bacterium]